MLVPDGGLRYARTEFFVGLPRSPAQGNLFTAMTRLQSRSVGIPTVSSAALIIVVQCSGGDFTAQFVGVLTNTWWDRQMTVSIPSFSWKTCGKCDPRASFTNPMVSCCWMLVDPRSPPHSIHNLAIAAGSSSTYSICLNMVFALYRSSLAHTYGDVGSVLVLSTNSKY